MSKPGRFVPSLRSRAFSVVICLVAMLGTQASAAPVDSVVDPAMPSGASGILHAQSPFPIPENVSAVPKPAVRQLANGFTEFTLPSGKTFLTHGPDAKTDEEPTTPALHSALRQPVCATDHYQHILYGRQALLPSRFDEFVGDIRDVVREMNALLNEESLESGNVEADFKVKCDSQGEIQVDEFTSIGVDYYSVFAAAESAGFDDPNAKYSIFFDSDGGAFCGVGTFHADESPSQNNSNNNGTSYAVTYEPCWFGRTPMHENGHNMGAVQYNAPYSTGDGAHCYEDMDVMCYAPDGGDKNQTESWWRCEDRTHYDCGHDTYFDSAPEEGEYLSDHWNIGSRVNRYIKFGEEGVSPPPPPPGNQLPIVTFSRSCVNTECRFSPWAQDPDGEINSLVWDFDDGTRSGRRSPSHVFSTAGEHTVTLTAVDDQFEATSISKVVTIHTVDPDPSATWLWMDDYVETEGPEADSWHHYKIWVPPGARDLSIYLSTDCQEFACQPWVPPLDCVLDCNPDPAIFVRAGSKPTLDDYDCKSDRSPPLTDPFYYSYYYASEECEIETLAPGFYYVGVRESIGTGFRYYLQARYDDLEGRNNYYVCGASEPALLGPGTKNC